MTIQKQLFIFISALILMITATQIFLLFYFKQSVESEIRERSNVVAERILNFTLDEFSTDNEFEEFLEADTNPRSRNTRRGAPFSISITELDSKSKVFEQKLPLHIVSDPTLFLVEIDAAPEIVKPDILHLASQLGSQGATQIEIRKEGYLISVQRQPRFPKRLFKKHLMKQFQIIKDAGLRETSDNVIFIDTDHNITDHPPSPVKHFKRSVKARHSIINNMFQYVILILIITSLLALLAVYWLSRKISKPLQGLTIGFKRMESGELGTTVPSEGVAEVQYVIEQFNNMSQKLVKLSEAEKMLTEQQHLSEIGDVSKGIAHALRNPIHTIGLAIEQLQDVSLPEATRKKLVQKVFNKIAQLDKSIQALLTVTNGDIQRDQDVDLANVIHDVCLELKQSHQVENQPMDIQLELSDNLTLRGEINEIRTVVHTLIFNAYDAAKTNKDKIEIRIGASSKDNRINLTVFDNGNGLDPQIQQELFKPHVSTKAEGAGMGLYISQRILNLYYRGQLTLSNSTASRGVEALAVFTQEQGPE